MIGVALYEWLGPAPYVMNIVVMGALLAYAFWDVALKRAGVTAQEAPEVGTPV